MDGAEFERTHFGTVYLSVLFNVLEINEKHVIQNIYPFIDANVSKSSWTEQFAAIMVFSITLRFFQGYEDVKDPSKIFPKDLNSRMEIILKKIT